MGQNLVQIRNKIPQDYFLTVDYRGFSEGQTSSFVSFYPNYKTRVTPIGETIDPLVAASHGLYKPFGAQASDEFTIVALLYAPYTQSPSTTAPIVTFGSTGITYWQFGGGTTLTVSVYYFPSYSGSVSANITLTPGVNLVAFTFKKNSTLLTFKNGLVVAEVAVANFAANISAFNEGLVINGGSSTHPLGVVKTWVYKRQLTVEELKLFTVQDGYSLSDTRHEETIRFFTRGPYPLVQRPTALPEHPKYKVRIKDEFKKDCTHFWLYDSNPISFVDITDIENSSSRMNSGGFTTRDSFRVKETIIGTGIVPSGSGYALYSGTSTKNTLNQNTYFVSFVPYKVGITTPCVLGHLTSGSGNQTLLLRINSDDSISFIMGGSAINLISDYRIKVGEPCTIVARTSVSGTLLQDWWINGVKQSTSAASSSQSGFSVNRNIIGEYNDGVAFVAAGKYGTILPEYLCQRLSVGYLEALENPISIEPIKPAPRPFITRMVKEQKPVRVSSETNTPWSTLYDFSSSISNIGRDNLQFTTNTSAGIIDGPVGSALRVGIEDHITTNGIVTNLSNEITAVQIVHPVLGSDSLSDFMFGESAANTGAYNWGFYNSGGGYPTVFIHNGTTGVFSRLEFYLWNTSAALYYPQVWVMTYSASTGKINLWVNGIRAPEATTSGNIQRNSAATLSIQRWSQFTSNRFFIYAAAVSNRCMSPTEVMNNFSNINSAYQTLFGYKPKENFGVVTTDSGIIIPPKLSEADIFDISSTGVTPRVKVDY